MTQVLEKGLPGSELPWLSQVRASSLARFKELGLPKATDEEWRFTNLEEVAKTEFAPAPGAPPVGGLGLGEPAEWALCDFDCDRLTFIDGYLAPELSTKSPGMQAASLARMIKNEPQSLEPYLTRIAGASAPFVCWNNASFGDGAVIHLPKATITARPIHILHVSLGPGEKPVAAHPRVLIVTEKNCQAVVVEEHVGLSRRPMLTNAVTEVYLGENSRLEHYQLCRENDHSFHVATTHIRQERASSYVSHSVSLGGAIARNDVNVVLEGEGSECALNGLYLTRGRQHVDNRTIIDHSQARTTSRELYKGVLDGQSRAVFNGTIIVRPNAQKTSARQDNKNLLLSSGALVNTKPEFKIFANDVQCKHGATIGQLSPDALFYLRSRGLGEAQARALLTYAFASEMLAPMTISQVKEALAKHVRPDTDS